MRTLLATALCTAVAVLAVPRVAQAEINRCHAADGTLVFTDQSCDLLGTTYKLTAAYQPGTDVRRPGKSLRGRLLPRFGIGCAAHSPEGMRSAVKMAIDSGDPNQLSALIDWNGTKRRPAMETMRRLQHIVSRPVVAVELGGSSEFDLQPAMAMTTASWGDSTTQARVGAIDAAGTYAAQPAGLPSLHILRAHGESTPMEHTRFALVRDAGCVWLRP